jgi:hypothetical protein
MDCDSMESDAHMDTEGKVEVTESGAFEAQLTYQFEPEMYRTFARLYMRRTMWRGNIGLILMLNALLVVYFMGSQNWFSLICVICASAALVLPIWHWWWPPKIHFPTGSFRLGIREDSISIGTVGVSTPCSAAIRWTRFKELWCHKSVWILFFEKGCPCMIIPAESASEDFKKLLLEKAANAGVKIVAI